jgi:hypothetical protein
MRKENGISIYKAILAIAILLVIGGVLFKLNASRNSKATAEKLQVAANSPMFTFKEWGLQIKVPEAMSGFSYTTSQPKTGTKLDSPAITGPAPPNDAIDSLVFTRLYLDKYTEAANKCFSLDSKTPQYFASLMKNTGDSSKTTLKGVEIIKSFKDYYISNIGPSVGSAAKCTNSSAQKDLVKLNSDLDQALKSAFQTAQEVK